MTGISISQGGALKKIPVVLWFPATRFAAIPTCGANKRYVPRLLHRGGTDILQHFICGVACAALAINFLVVAGALPAHAVDIPKPVSPSTEQIRETTNISAFFRAIRTGDIQTIEKFLRAGINVNTSIEEARHGMRAGRTPLQAASESNQYEVTKYLIKNGASVNGKGSIGAPPLTSAARAGAYNIVELLVEKGADVNAVDNNTGGTALMAASFNDHYRVAKYLIAKGADVNAKSKEGYTALHSAASGAGKNLSELLLFSGANVNARTNNGTTPLRLNTESHYYADVAEVLLSRGADPNLPDDDNRTPLNSAIIKCHMATAELLLSKGADVTAADKLGMTALHRAVLSFGDPRCKLRDSLRIAQLLLLKGARVDIADNKGRTPLSLATDRKEMLALLNSTTTKGGDQKSIAAFQPDLATKHVATLYGKNIYVDDVRPPPAEINNFKNTLPEQKYHKWLYENEKRLMEISIWFPLRQAYMKEHRITATDAEIQDALTGLNRSNSDKSLIRQTTERRQEPTKLDSVMRNVGYQLVTNWKFDKALHERFGGKIFYEESKQVGRPLESYKRLLVEMEKAKDLQFYDESVRSAFYVYFTKPSDEKKILPANHYAKPFWSKN